MMEIFLEDLFKIAQEMSSAPQKNKVIFFATTANLENPDVYFSNLRYSENSVSLYIVFKSSRYIQDVVSIFNEIVNFYIVDIEKKSEYKDLYKDCVENIVGKDIFPFRPNSITAFGFEIFMSAFKGADLANSQIAICGLGDLASRIVESLSLYSKNLHLISRSLDKSIRCAREWGVDSAFNYMTFSQTSISVDIMISCVSGVGILDQVHLEKIINGGIFIDIGGGALTPEKVSFLRSRDIRILSFSVAPVIVQWLETFLKYKEMSEGLAYGYSKNGKSLVKFGYYGNYGDFIVDNVLSPQKVFGMSDGYGAIIRKCLDLKDL